MARDELPTGPVIVIHLESEAGSGLAACCGLPWKKDPRERHGETLWFCTGCANLLRSDHVGRHKPGDPHRYRLICDVCKELGTLRISVDPGFAEPSR